MGLLWLMVACWGMLFAQPISVTITADFDAARNLREHTDHRRIHHRSECTAFEFIVTL